MACASVINTFCVVETFRRLAAQIIQERGEMVPDECRDAAESKAAGVLENDAAEATKLGITGTPTFVIAQAATKEVTGERIIGAQPLAAFTTPIDELLKGSK